MFFLNQIKPMKQKKRYVQIGRLSYQVNYKVKQKQIKQKCVHLKTDTQGNTSHKICKQNSFIIMDKFWFTKLILDSNKELWLFCRLIEIDTFSTNVSIGFIILNFSY